MKSDKAFLYLMDNLKRGLGLSLSLAKANFKLRNEGSYLGVLWYLLEPLCFFLIILLIGGVINQDSIKYYALYLLLGLIMFNFFISATTNALKSMTSNAGIIRSMKINQESLVMAGVFQFVFSHILEMVIFLMFMIYFKANFIYLIFYFPIFLFFLLFILGLSFLLATLGVYVNDMSNVWSVAVRLLWFLTPIFYVMPPSSLFQKISYINPMFHFINISREIIIYGKIPGIFTLFLMVFFSVSSLLFGLFIFRKYKSKFAERL